MQYSSFTSKLFCLLVTLLTSACAAPKKKTNVYHHSDPALQKLAEAASSVSNSLDKLAEIEYANMEYKALTPPLDPTSYDMGQKTSLNWQGPLEPLLAKIARITHYELHILGPTPSIPIMLSLAETNQPIGTILRNISYQSSGKARVVIFPKRRLIELRYSRS